MTCLALSLALTVTMPLPHGSYWHTASFTGVALLYRTLLQQNDPTDYLINLWRTLAQAGREHMLEQQ